MAGIYFRHENCIPTLLCFWKYFVTGNKFYRNTKIVKKAVIVIESHFKTTVTVVSFQWQHYESYVNFETLATISNIISLAKCTTCLHYQ